MRAAKEQAPCINAVALTCLTSRLGPTMQAMLYSLPVLDCNIRARSPTAEQVAAVLAASHKANIQPLLSGQAVCSAAAQTARVHFQASLALSSAVHLATLSGTFTPETIKSHT